MSHITLHGASISTSFVKGFKKCEAFIKAMEGHIPDWTGEDREKKLKSVWNQANGKKEVQEPVAEEPTAE